MPKTRVGTTITKGVSPRRGENNTPVDILPLPPSPDTLLYEIFRHLPHLTPRWAIAIPHRNDFSQLFWQYLTAQEGLDMSEGVFLLPNRFQYDRYRSIALNRAHACQQAIQLGVEKLVFVDSDILVPRWGIKALLDTPGDVVGTLYYSKYSRNGPAESGKVVKPREPFSPVVKDIDGVYGKLLTTRAEVIEVQAVGFGLVALSARQLRDSIPLEPYNEDFKFCHSVREHGGTILLHTGVVCGHQQRGPGVVIPLGWCEWEALIGETQGANG